MAHALHRVSLSTARPVDAQFAFVSHNPGRADAQLYCHVFRARHARAVRHGQSLRPAVRIQKKFPAILPVPLADFLLILDAILSR